MAEKKYRASTGISGFYYGIINDGTTAEEIHRVKFLQEISIEKEGDISEAYGDNTTAELAYSSGNTTVTSQFHKIPLEDKRRLFGWEEQGGITAVGSDDNPPYVAVVFYKTHEDGSREYVGLPKGMFMPPTIEGQTKEDSVEFSSEESEARFMDRKIDGFTKNKSMLIANVDADDSEDLRDDIFKKLFGENYVEVGDEDETEPTTTTTTTNP